MSNYLGKSGVFDVLPHGDHRRLQGCPMNPIMTPNECKVVQSCPEMVVKIVPKYGLIVPNLVSERTIKRGVPCIKTHAISTIRFQFCGVDAVRGSAKIVSRLLLDFTVVKILF